MNPNESVPKKKYSSWWIVAGAVAMIIVAAISSSNSPANPPAATVTSDTTAANNTDMNTLPNNTSTSSSPAVKANVYSTNKHKNAPTSNTTLQISTPPPVAAPVVTVLPPVSIPINYSSFTRITLTQYANNPSVYNGQKIQIGAMVKGFLPAGGSGGDTNYLSLYDPATDTQLMAEVSDSATYTTLVNDIAMPAAFIEVYGVGTVNHNFTNSFNATLSVPVIQFSAADACGNNYSCTGPLTHITQ